MIRVFLDANVYFAGFYSKEGASALVLELARRKKIQIVASRLVLREADRNLRKKTDSKTLRNFHRYLQETRLQIVPPPSDQFLAQFEPYIHPKDVPVLTAAVEAKVNFIVTLDRRHFLTPQVLSHAGKIKILTPADFLRKI